MADRVPKKALLLGAAVASALWALAIPALGTSVPVLAGAMFLFGLVLSGLYTVGLAALASRFSGVDLGTANATFIMTYSVGMLLGPASMGQAIDRFGPGAMFHVAAIAMALYAALIVVRWRAE